MHGEMGGVHGMHPPHEIRPVISRAVRILLECILVHFNVVTSKATAMLNVYGLLCGKLAKEKYNCEDLIIILGLHFEL